MSTIPAKQISKVIAAPVRCNNFAALGADDTATTALTTALSTAGDLSASVPLQVSINTAGVGVIVTQPNNRVEIWDSTSKDKITNSAGDEVYGRISESAGVYTLFYHTLPNTGVEAAHSFPASRNIDFEFNYRFDFRRFPGDGIIGVSTRNVAQDAALWSGNLQIEQLTVTATNAIAALSRVPTAAETVVLHINGVTYDAIGGASADFAVNLTTRAITWSVANAGFNVETDDRVIAQYITRE